MTPRLRAGLFMAALGLAAVGAWWRSRPPPINAPSVGGPQAGDAAAVTARYLALEAAARAADAAVWRDELEALRHAATFTVLWDDLRSEPEQGLARLAREPVGQVEHPPRGASETLPHGIRRAALEGAPVRHDAAGWQAWLAAQAAAGWRLEQSEWRLARYAPAHAGGPAGTVRAWGHLRHVPSGRRAILRGELEVAWGEAADAATPPPLRTVRLAAGEWLERGAGPGFTVQLQQFIPAPPDSPHLDPLILEDLDGDGLSEILLVGRNRAYWNRDGRTFAPERLLPPAPFTPLAAVLADFTGDGQPDLLLAAHDGLWLAAGDPDGRFRAAPRPVWRSTEPLPNPFVLAAADVDGDARLDVWLAQYKLPYVAGQMPTPYHDANDGFPSFLLRQRADGTFEDVTVAAGLGARRFRRTYSASFVDLDDDGHPDLVNVSDFAGVDLFLNDGRGRFREATARLVDNPRLFGMAHAWADLDGDARPDLLAIGMNSFTAQRMIGLQAGPPERDDVHRWRADLAFGNRLYFRRGGRFAEEPSGAALAETGWSWGVAVFDADRDGHADVHIVNGHKSRATVQDYETQFWRHDLYVATSRHDPALDRYFRATQGRLFGEGWSYGGFEKNRFFLNRGGREFIETAWLLGLGAEEDCRNLVADDLDGDGRPDLLMLVHRDWPEPAQALRVVRNELPGGHWIAFRLRGGPGGFHPAGARVEIEAGGRRQVRVPVNGDSFRSQHAAVAHFGLGAAAEVTRAVIRWPNGAVQELAAPGINRQHVIRPAAGR